jgi:hypothetical protein
VCSLAQWKDLRPWRPEFGPEGKHFVSGNRLFLFLKNKKQRSCDGRGGAQRPFWRVNEPKKTGARSARARTRGQNTLVTNKLFTGQGQQDPWMCLMFINSYASPIHTFCPYTGDIFAIKTEDSKLNKIIYKMV